MSKTENDKPARCAVASGSAVFFWHCDDCRESGNVAMQFPIHPDDLAGRIHNAHIETQRRRRCMCPGHYLSISPNDGSEPRRT